MTPNSRSYLNRWAQPDSDVPESQGVQAFDRYAYVNNNPLRYTDSSGHRIDDDGSVIPQAHDGFGFLNPFSYDTVSFTAHGLGKAVIGVDININISVDTRPIREGYAADGWVGAMDGFMNIEYAATLDGSLDIGASIEGAIVAGFTGSDGGVLDGTGLNLIGKDGVTVNYGVVLPPGAEPGFAIQGSTTVDPYSDNGLASSQSWTAGVGAGICDLGVSLVSVSDWFFYGNTSKDSHAFQVPFVTEKFINKVKDAIRR